MKLPVRQIKPYLLLAPALIFFLCLVGYGLILMVAASLQTSQGGSLSLIYYERVLYNPSFWDSLFLSLKITIVSTVGSLALGVLMVRGLFQFSQNNSLQSLWIWLPMLIPHFVAAYLVFLFFAQSGWISALLYNLNLIATQAEFPIVVNDREGIGIMLTYLWKELPFVVLMLLPVYANLNKKYEDVVRTLGGGSWQVFKTVEWPWLYPVLIETGVIIFAFIISAYEVPFLLGVTYPKMLPVLAFQWFFEGDWSNRPLVMVVFTLTTGLILGLALAAFKLLQRQRFKTMLGKEN